MHLVLRLRDGRTCPTQVRIGGVIVFKGDVDHIAELKLKMFHSLCILPCLQDYGLPDGRCPSLGTIRYPSLEMA